MWGCEWIGKCIGDYTVQGVSRGFVGMCWGHKGITEVCGNCRGGDMRVCRGCEGIFGHHGDAQVCSGVSQDI